MPTYGSFTYGESTYTGPEPGGAPPVPAPPAPTLVLPAPVVRTLTRFHRNLPALYSAESSMQIMAAAVAAEFDLVYDALAQIQAQAFVLSATWGIQYWEELLGLLVAPEVTLESRRAAVMAALAPSGPVTLNSIEGFVSKFRHGAVNVTYIPQLWQIGIEFADFRGKPPDLPQLQSGLDALVPAWLSLNYTFRFTTYGELKAWGLTYHQLKALLLTYGQLQTWVPAGQGASQANNTAATFAQPTSGLIAQTNSTAATFAQPSTTLSGGT